MRTTSVRTICSFAFTAIRNHFYGDNCIPNRPTAGSFIAGLLRSIPITPPSRFSSISFHPTDLQAEIAGEVKAGGYAWQRACQWIAANLLGFRPVRRGDRRAADDNIVLPGQDELHLAVDFIPAGARETVDPFLDG
jgi:hypothetical protein